MQLSVIAIGDELLIGQVVDTNSGMIARAISPAGWEVKDVRVVSDAPDAITDAIDQAFEKTDVIITTGGLGPTKDDLTKNVLARYFGGTLVRDPEVTANIERVFAGRGLKLNPLTADQALVPTSCTVIQNLVGTAPIMWFERPDGKVLVAMPGVPFETETMFPEVFARLQNRFPTLTRIAHRVVMVAGLTESALAMRLADWEDSAPENLHLAYLPKQGVIRLRLDAHASTQQEAEELAETGAAQICALLEPGQVIARRDAQPPEILLDMCRERGLILATAESCTGGNIAHSLTLVPGASDVVAGGVVSYSNHVKQALLGVKEETLAENGAVSIPVVEQMALGAIEATGATLSMATSGIAGPGGGSAEKPVGTVCIAACLNRPGQQPVIVSDTRRFNGNRARIIETSTTHAILMAINLIYRTEHE